MSVSLTAVAPVPPKLIGPHLQKSSVKELLPGTNSYDYSSSEPIGKIVINDTLKPQLLSNIFPVQFIYMQKLMSTKVIKVDHGYDHPFYKVVLTMALHNSALLWWLQLQPNGWDTLLGPKLNEKLKRAIISAILRHELLATE
jgi:hypothetical protein